MLCAKLDRTLSWLPLSTLNQINIEKDQVEDEHHFLFKCPTFEDLRIKFLKDSVRLPLYAILKATNTSDRYNLSRYIFHGMNRRKKIIF